jgi:hypothetical protein
LDAGTSHLLGVVAGEHSVWLLHSHSHIFYFRLLLFTAFTYLKRRRKLVNLLVLVLLFALIKNTKRLELVRNMHGEFDPSLLLSHITYPTARVESCKIRQ